MIELMSKVDSEPKVNSEPKDGRCSCSGTTAVGNIAHRFYSLQQSRSRPLIYVLQHLASRNPPGAADQLLVST